METKSIYNSLYINLPVWKQKGSNCYGVDKQIQPFHIHPPQTVINLFPLTSKDLKWQNKFKQQQKNITAHNYNKRV